MPFGLGESVCGGGGGCRLDGCDGFSRLTFLSVVPTLPSSPMPLTLTQPHLSIIISAYPDGMSFPPTSAMVSRIMSLEKSSKFPPTNRSPYTRKSSSPSSTLHSCRYSNRNGHTIGQLSSPTLWEVPKQVKYCARTTCEY